LSLENSDFWPEKGPKTPIGGTTQTSSLGWPIFNQIWNVRGVLESSEKTQAPFSVEILKIEFYFCEKIDKRTGKTPFFGFSNFRPRKIRRLNLLNSPACSTRLGRPDAHSTFEIGRKHKSEIEKCRQKCPFSRFLDFSIKKYFFNP